MYRSQSFRQLVRCLEQQLSGLVESVSSRLLLSLHPDIPHSDYVLIVALKRGIGAQIGLQLFKTLAHVPDAFSYLCLAALVLLGYSWRCILAARYRWRGVNASRNASEQVQEVGQGLDLRRDPIAPNLQLRGRDRSRFRC